MPEIPEAYKDYIAWDRLPHMWCSGCGHGITLKAIVLALAELGIPPHKALLASGIGCSGRTGDYVTFHRFQGTHGRTLAFATGINAAQPDLKIIAFLGDGDCYAIGGNHLLHAARRNLNITVIVGNNCNYGMTGGQFSPATPAKKLTSTSRFGKSEYPIDMCNLVAEALLPCPTYYGRYNKLGTPVEMMQRLKNICIPLKEYEKLGLEERQNFYWRGIKIQREKEDFHTGYIRQYDNYTTEKGGDKK